MLVLFGGGYGSSVWDPHVLQELLSVQSMLPDL